MEAGQHSAVSGTDPAFAPRQVQGLHRHERRRGQRPAACCRRPANCSTRGWTSASAISKRTAAPKRKPSSKGFRSRAAPQTLLQGQGTGGDGHAGHRQPPPRDRRRGRTGPHQHRGGAKPKRWQDDADPRRGISVISAVNIQHIEGLNEVVEEITASRSASGFPTACWRWPTRW